MYNLISTQEKELHNQEEISKKNKVIKSFERSG
jgi:hypothetical protein